MIVLYAREAKRANDNVFRLMWLAITLSFGFYLPVVLFAEQIPMPWHADDSQDARLRLDRYNGAKSLLESETGCKVIC